MPNPYFKFKQFTVFQDKCAMKVGIDGVLLGAWANTTNTLNILDIGTGTGLIALMLAQRCNATIKAIDIEPNAVIQAKENIEASPWKEQIAAMEIPLQNFIHHTSDKFDLIISNPPFFINSLKAPDSSRNIARHTDTLTHQELIDCSAKIMSPVGRICLILPEKEGLECIEYAKLNGFYCYQLVYVHPKPWNPAKRLLIELWNKPTETIISHLVIETENRHEYSEAFTKLAKEFYLKL
ncbi:MAG: methyltransferase [Paludibacter sp.]|nr:methyltransferase [Paludibacter sp.]